MRSQWYCWRGGRDGGSGVVVGGEVEVEEVDDADGGVDSILGSDSGVVTGVFGVLVLIFASVQM